MPTTPAATSLRTDTDTILETENEPDNVYSTGEFKVANIQVDIPAENAKFSWRKFLSFVGPGFFISIGYIDPGNWATDISSGSRWGYQLLWVLLLSNMMALLLQMLAVRLGLVTENDLAQTCRKEYPKKVRYVLWFLCEIAIAATDLAEVLGTAIGLQLLLRIPLLVGVTLTVFDTLLFLLVQRFGIRKLEGFVFGLLATVTLCFVVELFLCKPNASDLFQGFIPRINSQSLYDALGMLGATVMPHNFYLHSSVVQTRKFGRAPSQIRIACIYNLVDSAFALNIAFFVNASILIVAAAVFHAGNIEVTELQDAHNLLEVILNSSLAPIAFGLGLFCAGQSSTLTGTMAGQIVMEGFLTMRLRPWIRRLVTRLVAIVPALIVISIMGDSGTYQLLILSQVILSVQLPFAIVPLIRFTSDKRLMGQFQNPLWVTILASLSAMLIISLNLWLVGQNIYALLVSESKALLAIGILILPVALALLGLLAYVAFRGLPTLIKKKINRRYHEEGRELTETEMEEPSFNEDGTPTMSIRNPAISRANSITLTD